MSLSCIAWRLSNVTNCDCFIPFIDHGLQRIAVSFRELEPEQKQSNIWAIHFLGVGHWRHLNDDWKKCRVQDCFQKIHISLLQKAWSCRDRNWENMARYKCLPGWSMIPQEGLIDWLLFTHSILRYFCCWTHCKCWEVPESGSGVQLGSKVFPSRSLLLLTFYKALFFIPDISIMNMLVRKKPLKILQVFPSCKLFGLWAKPMERAYHILIGKAIQYRLSHMARPYSWDYHMQSGFQVLSIRQKSLSSLHQKENLGGIGS